MRLYQHGSLYPKNVVTPISFRVAQKNDLFPSHLYPPCRERHPPKNAELENWLGGENYIPELYDMTSFKSSRGPLERGLRKIFLVYSAGNFDPESDFVEFLVPDILEEIILTFLKIMGYIYV
jgi:hypothetical protein